MGRVKKITLAGKAGYPVNIYLVNSGTSLIMIDTGYQGSEAQVLRSVGTKKVEKILLTHYHPDHSEAAGELASQTGAKVYAHRAEIEALENRWGGVKVVPIEDGEDVGGEGVELVAIATPGHTKGHLAFLLREGRILFSGDLVVGDSTTWVGPPDGDVGDYLDSLLRLQKMEIAKIYPGHGPEIIEPGEKLVALIRHRKMREEQIINQLRKGAQSLLDLIAEIYPVLDQKLWVVARLTIIGHLIKLEKEGKVVMVPGKEDRYQLLSGSD